MCMFQVLDIIQRAKSTMDICLSRAAAIFCRTSFSLIMAAYTVVEVNAWILRCIFNRSDVPQRISTGEFTLRRNPRAKPSKLPGHPVGTKSQHVWIHNRLGTEVATAH